MTDPNVENRSRTQRRPTGYERRSSGYVWAAAALVILLIGGLTWRARAAAVERTRARLLESSTEAVVKDPELVKAATTEAQPLFAQHCARCHGETMQGDPAIGAPNLADGVWLYGSGEVFDIERTILYGVRSEMPQTHHVSDMPPFGLVGTLRPGEIRDVVQYVLELSGRPHDGQAALAGRELFFGRGTCFDCHGTDGKGNPDYGAPDLTANVWNSGGDPESLYKSIYFGQHRVMPGWINKLTLEQIRALSVYIYEASHSSNAGKSPGDAYVARARTP
jgi:cytochrome c oxidase cbb3-type subunit III